jgi:adenine-specific DNA-methyltransferase
MHTAFSRPKILTPDIAKRHRFTIDRSGLFPGNTIYGIAQDDLYLLGLLNSSIIEEIYAGISSQVRGGYVRFFRPYMERIPIVIALSAEKLSIEELVRKCLDAKGQGPQVAECEAEIDERVAWLYGLKSPPGRPEPDEVDAEPPTDGQS